MASLSSPLQGEAPRGARWRRIVILPTWDFATSRIIPDNRNWERCRRHAPLLARRHCTRGGRLDRGWRNFAHTSSLCSHRNRRCVRATEGRTYECKRDGTASHEAQRGEHRVQCTAEKAGGRRQVCEDG